MSNKTALQVIDVQQGMFDEAYTLYRSDELLETLQQLLDRAHAAHMPVIYIQHCGTEEGHPLAPTAPGWPIHHAIAPRSDEIVITKQHPDSFQDTSLQSQLEALGVKELIVAGLQTEFCVDTTCRRAYS